MENLPIKLTLKRKRRKKQNGHKKPYFKVKQITVKNGCEDEHSISSHSLTNAFEIGKNGFISYQVSSQDKCITELSVPLKQHLHKTPKSTTHKKTSSVTVEPKKNSRTFACSYRSKEDHTMPTTSNIRANGHLKYITSPLGHIPKASNSKTAEASPQVVAHYGTPVTPMSFSNQFSELFSKDMEDFCIQIKRDSSNEEVIRRANIIGQSLYFSSKFHTPPANSIYHYMLNKKPGEKFHFNCCSRVLQYAQKLTPSLDTPVTKQHHFASPRWNDLLPCSKCTLDDREDMSKFNSLISNLLNEEDKYQIFYKENEKLKELSFDDKNHRPRNPVFLR